MPSAPPRIRIANPDEYDAIGELTLRTYDQLEVSFSDDYRLDLGNAHKRAATSALQIVALIGSKIGGALTLSLGDTEMFEHVHGVDGDCGFRMLAVDPTEQGRGIGRALVTDSIIRCGDAGFQRMVITSMSFMPSAHRLYEQLGFVRRADLDVRYPSGVGMGFTLDLTADAAQRFPAPGPIPDEPPWYLDAECPPEVPCG